MFGKLFDWWKMLEGRMDRTMGKDISTPAARRRAKYHYHFIDHGVLRVWWSNLFQIAPGVWRSNQPSQGKLRKYKEMGIDTVINLRGKTGRSPYLFEEESCRELGIKMINHKLSARSLARKSELLSLLDTFETVDKPFVMHCKSGADRAGLASALYLLHIEKAPIAVARKQLSFRYAHIRQSQTGVLDHMLDAYEADCQEAEISIREWIETKYRPKKLQRVFEGVDAPISGKAAKSSL